MSDLLLTSWIVSRLQSQDRTVEIIGAVGPGAMAALRPPHARRDVPQARGAILHVEHECWSGVDVPTELDDQLIRASLHDVEKASGDAKDRAALVIDQGVVPVERHLGLIWRVTAHCCSGENSRP
jgi:hypothetical protein